MAFVGNKFIGSFMGAGFVASGCFVGEEPGGPSRRLVVVVGQSNANNYTASSGLTDSSYAANYPAVRYIARTANNTTPPTVEDHAVGDLRTLTITVIGAGDRIGIPASLGRDLDDAVPYGWAIAQMAYNGSSLVSHWDPSGTYPTSDPTNLFTQFVAFVRAAEAATGSRLAAIVWEQGETDAGTEAHADAYDTNLVAFVTALRAQLGTVPFLYGRLNTDCDAAFTANLRASQAAADGALTDLIMVDQDTVNLSGDNTHYTADGFVALGHLFATAVLDALGIAPPAGPAWSTDGGWAVPATDAEWTAFLAANTITANPPTSGYLCQDTAAPLADYNGVISMAAGGTGHQYEVAVTGMTGKAVQLTDGTSGNWASSNAALPDISTTSCTILAVVEVPAGAPAATRNVFMLGTVTSLLRQIATSGVFGMTNGANPQNGAADPRGRLMPVWLQVDQTNNVGRAVTDQENFSATWAGTVTGKLFRIGSSGSASGIKYRAVYRWDGAGAEMALATMQAINTAIKP